MARHADINKSLFRIAKELGKHPVRINLSKIVTAGKTNLPTTVPWPGTFLLVNHMRHSVRISL